MPSRTKKTARSTIGRILEILEAILLLSLAAALFYLTRPVLHLPPSLTIASGDVGAIISQLRKNGADVGPIDAILLSGFAPLPVGTVKLGPAPLSRIDLLYLLASPGDRYRAVTLIPGETTAIFLRQLSRQLALPYSKLLEAFRRQSPWREGAILADTYNVPLRYDANRTMSYLLNLSRKRMERLAREAGVGVGSPGWHRILVVASIVQKEAGNRGEMPLVASVIYNRLGKKMRLQMDGTLNYGIYSHIRVTPRRIREDNTTYNTYKHRGLPEAPVCNVSVAAIRAAIHPATTPYLYFIRNDRGGHDFFKTYKEHLREVHQKRRRIRERNASEPKGGYNTPKTPSPDDQPKGAAHHVR